MTPVGHFEVCFEIELWGWVGGGHSDGKSSCFAQKWYTEASSHQPVTPERQFNREMFMMTYFSTGLQVVCGVQIYAKVGKENETEGCESTGSVTPGLRRKNPPLQEK